MKFDGVYEVKGDTLGNYVYVTYDPEKTNVEAFEQALSKQQFFVRGKPVFIK